MYQTELFQSDSYKKAYRICEDNRFSAKAALAFSKYLKKRKMSDAKNACVDYSKYKKSIGVSA